MGRLQTLKVTLQAPPSAARMLTTETATPRPRGEAWMDQRLRIQIRDHSRCAKCGLLWTSSRDVVDHRIPRWAGGTDDDSNLWLLHANPCHDEKTAGEEVMRRTTGYVEPAWVSTAWRAVQASWRRDTAQHQATANGAA